jgi:long-subunit acyl-CoA synthetase (AMP-forming)
MSSIVLEGLSSIAATLPAIDDGALRLSYEDLRRSVAQEQRWLQSKRVRCCGLLAGNSARWIISDLALLAANVVNVPIPAYFTGEQTRHVLDDAGVDSILTDDPERLRRQHSTFAFVAMSHRTGLALFQRNERSMPSSIANISKVTYTSGSTGTPKGVCLSARAIDQVTQAVMTATAGIGVDKHLCLLPLATLLENLAGVYVPLSMGAKAIVPPAHVSGVGNAGLDLPLLLRAIDAASPQSLILVPELLRALLHAIGGGWRAPSSLKFIAVGGGAVSPLLLQRAEQVGLPVFQGYGLSECASVVCLNTPAHNKPGSVGRPLGHARVRIDASGEICVSGATMSGYLGDAQHDRLEIRTGDLGAIDADGFVHVRGRAKNMFITSMGRNITPEWVESELISEPAILQAMVTGEARPYPVALLVAAPGAGLELIEQAILRANSRLPDYARVRRWALFPTAPSLGNGLLTANGRLRRADILASHDDLINSLYDHADSEAHEFS